MNKLLVCRMLGVIVLLIGAAMAMSLPWALPALGQVEQFEAHGFFAILGTMVLCGLVGGGLMWTGRTARQATLFRREAIAVVGLGWILAALLGAVPFLLSGTCYDVDDNGRPLRMGPIDAIFESASGFTGTGATVLTNLEDPRLLPRTVLFWRSATHFLGGLGIIVLFVAILGLGSAGKALLTTEMPGPSAELAATRSQRSALIFAAIFIGLCALLALLLRVQGMSLFDALCHAFGAVATGGFSTRNASVEYYQSAGIEMTIVVFMVLGCTNFTLLYFLVLRQPGRLLRDVEFRVYIAVLASATLLIVASLYLSGDYDSPVSALRYGLFQTVSIQTNTGFGTADFDQWNPFSKAMLLTLMFVGGCAGSTSCSVKVIRYVLFFKFLRVRLELVFHPTVVRPVRVGDKPVADPELLQNVALYIAVIAMIFAVGTLLLTAIEPDHTWTDDEISPREKIVDCASAVAATLNGVGPGLGIVGESRNYARFHFGGKLLLTAMMLLGRLEVFVLAVLLMPRFWRRQ